MAMTVAQFNQSQSFVKLVPAPKNTCQTPIANVENAAGCNKWCETCYLLYRARVDKNGRSSKDPRRTVRCALRVIIDDTRQPGSTPYASSEVRALKAVIPYTPSWRD